MTRNNLQDHLAWLVSNVQLSRPTGPSLSNVHEAEFDNPSRSFTSVLSQKPQQQSRRSDAPARTDASSSASTTITATRNPHVPAPEDFDVDDELLLNEDTIVLDEEDDSLGSATVVRGVDMAKLTTKSSKKPSLVSKQEQLPTPPTTAVGKLGKAYTASLNSTSDAPKLLKAYTATLNKDSARRTSSPISKASRSRTPSRVTGVKKSAPRHATPEIPDDVDEEILQDLTGADDIDPDATTSTWDYTFGSPQLLFTEEHAWRPEPPPSRGKKRKSCERAEPSPKPKSKSKLTLPVKEEDDDFPDICDLVDDDALTPAIIKRRNAGFSSAASKKPPKLHMPASDAGLLTQRTVTQTVSTTETTIHRTASLNRTPYQSSSLDADTDDSPLGRGKEVMPPPQPARRSTVSNPSKPRLKQREPNGMRDEDSIPDGGRFEPQNSSPKPKRTGKFKRSDVIMDSDDEESAEFETPPTRNVSDISFITAATGGTVSGSKRKPISPGPSEARSSIPTVETPSKKRPVPLLKSKSQSGRRSESCVSMDRMDVDHEEEQGAPHGERSRESHSPKPVDETLLLDLFKQQPHVLDVIKEAIAGKLHENAINFRKSIQNNWPPERRAQIKQEKPLLQQQMQAVLDAKTAHTEYIYLSAESEKLVNEIMSAYEANEDIEDLECRHETLSDEVKKSARGLKQKLVAADVKVEMFNDQSDPSPRDPERPDLDGTRALATTAKHAPSISRESNLIPECVSQTSQQSQATARPPSRTVAIEPQRPVARPPVPQFSRAEARPTRAVENRSSTKSLSRTVQEDLDMDDFPDDDDLWDQPDAFQPRTHASSMFRAAGTVRSRSPAKSKTRQQDHFSDYGDGDDDVAALVAMAEQAEEGQSSLESRVNRRARSVFSETSGNAVPLGRIRALAKKPAKPKPKLQINQALMNHPWSNDLLRAFKDRFRLQGFRENQLEAINATLAGQDAFVLMPTGGGKSLCYQLPAVINSGKTRGVTIVVTPLLSLMQDQVDHLTARGIIAKAFNGDMPQGEKRDILQSFSLKNPEHHVQLLYVTPEMINKSTQFLNGLQTLHRNKKLARLVIDEAHCVSQWGHDFRPDYKELGQVRQRFPGVPIIALTATATENVIVDVKHNLNMEHCTIFSQSFNRPNLYYEVRPKEKQPVDRIAELINERYQGKTGIVYTLSRKQTEQIAQKLNDHGIRAKHYHAAMSAEEKTTVQRAWQKGTIKVVVATIAFGMGIDKPDVRFVIHHYLPKSLEGYYQETGRAGRDGLPSDCYLFFSHGDIYQLRKFIDDSDGSRQQKERQKEMLNRVVMFCENTRDCRRYQLLRYFSETLSSDECGMACDNCKNGGVHDFEDRTEYAQAVLQAVMYYTRLTMNQCTEYLMGKKKPAEHEEPQPFHGIAKGLTKYEINAIITSLTFKHALDEENKLGGGGIPIQYFILGREAASFLTGGRPFPMLVRHGGNKKAPGKTTKKKATKKKAAEEAPSTCISSPVRGGARQSKKAKSVMNYLDVEAIAEDEEEDDLDPRGPCHDNGYEQDGFVVADDDDEDDYFDAPVPPPPRQRRQRTLDELTSHNSRAAPEPVIDDVHENIIGLFMEEVKKLEEETRNSRGLRKPLFTEVQLQQMAVRWTDTLDKMRRIPDIDSDKVGKYGPRFIPLIKAWHNKYLEWTATAEDDAMATIPATAGPATSRRGPPPQPEDVIDLLSDDEDDEDYEAPGEPSRYFGTGRRDHDDPLEAQLMESEHRFAATSQIEESASRGSGGRSYSKKGGAQGGKRAYYRKGGGGSRSGAKSYSGVSKRKSSGSNGSAGGSKRSSAGSGRSGAAKSTASTAKKSGGSGIGLMPF